MKGQRESTQSSRSERRAVPARNPNQSKEMLQQVPGSASNPHRSRPTDLVLVPEDKSGRLPASKGTTTGAFEPRKSPQVGQSRMQEPSGSSSLPRMPQISSRENTLSANGRRPGGLEDTGPTSYPQLKASPLTAAKKRA
eukprot:TRINITY_DN4122_c0_g1_i4.p2 TRINITY_DN4122_c0_g1~~TRINITY_DN4122_c0_g1_i4.p2  ORF type:complete len:139 (-),score=26.50 TRINITY_DN4122_c0_g1_i4:498-914(-)